MQTDEKELIALAKAHNGDAYGQLVDRYKNALYRHCFALLKDEDAAEDIAQDTFIAAYYKLDSFDDSRRFSTWLFKIATNKGLNYLRASKKTSLISDGQLERIVAPHHSPHQEAEDNELHNAVAKLDPKYQAVVAMYYFEGMDYETISDILGKPLGSVKGWMNRAKKQLRKELV